MEEGVDGIRALKANSTVVTLRNSGAVILTGSRPAWRLIAAYRSVLQPIDLLLTNPGDGSQQRARHRTSRSCEPMSPVAFLRLRGGA